MLEPIRLEILAGDLPDGGWRLVAGRGQGPGQPESATQAQLTFYGEWAEIARKSPAFQQELKIFLITKLTAQ